MALKNLKLNIMNEKLEIFRQKRTQIISKMLDNPSEIGI